MTAARMTPTARGAFGASSQPIGRSCTLLAVDMKSNAKDPEMNLRSGFANAGVPRNRAGGETGTIRELFRLPTGAARLR